MQRQQERREVVGQAESFSSLVEAVHRHAGLRGGKAALGKKVDGGWSVISYAELYGRVRDFAGGLKELGVRQGSRVALMSRNRPKWPIADLAIQSLGAATVPVYPTLAPEQVTHILGDSEAHIFIVEDEESLGRVRTGLDDARDLCVSVMEDGFGGEENVRRFRDVERAGAENPVGDWEKGWRSLGRDDAATVIYTSGTTGLPKGAVLTHGNILSNLEGILEALPVYEDDVFLSFLPLSHVFERTCGQFYALSVGATIYYAESIEKVPENLREVRPTVVPSVPRLYEKMYDRVRTRISEAPRRRRKLFDAAINAGKRKYAVEREGGTVGRALGLQLKLYDRLVFSKLREAVGGRVRFFVSGGAKLNAEVGEFFYAAGVKIMEGYGLTETSPVISCNRLERPRFGTVGLPLSNLEVRISEKQEIQVRGPSVMRGYLNNERANAEVFTEDGFFRTGDIGDFDEAGYLRITDRAKNLIVLSTGKNVAPQPIETALVATPHISQSIVLGDGRKYVSALIVPDYEAVRRSLDSDAPNAQLCEDGRVRALVEKDVEEATRGFAGYERPKSFAVLPRELSQEEGELTPTLKVKLRVVREHYAEVIEKLYS